MLEKVVIFILFLAPLIFFHELGHFIFARLFGVRVEVFSIGFGKKIFKYFKGGTTYAISIIPFGGYVKMFGDDPTSKDEIPEEEKKYSFTHKSKFAKFWIVLGGPLANIFFAYVIYSLLFMVGERVPETRFGVIPSNSIFIEKGIQTGDVLKKINGKEVWGIADIAVGDEHEKIESISVLRNETEKKIMLSSLTLKGFIDEFIKAQVPLRKPVLVDKHGKIFALTLKKGIVDWEYSLDTFNQVKDQKIKIYLYRAIEKVEESKSSFNVDYSSVVKLTVVGSKIKALTKLGYYPNDLQVKEVISGSPAIKAGIEKNDVIINISGTSLFSFEDLKENVKKGKKKVLHLTYLKNGKKFTKEIRPNVNGESVTIGVYSAVKYQPLRYIQRAPMNIFTSLKLGVQRTYKVLVKTLVSYKNLLTFSVSLKGLGGPVTIAKMATDSVKISVSYFFQFMAFISIQLGILNLLPIPVLDGGHIVFILIEVITRKSVSQKVMERALKVGVSILFALVFIALFNDITRLFN